MLKSKSSVQVNHLNITHSDTMNTRIMLTCINLATYQILVQLPTMSFSWF